MMIENPPSQLEKPRVNGFAKPAPSAAPVAGDRSLADVCSELRYKVMAFLDEETEDRVLQNVQGQVRISMGVIDEALARYEPEQLSLAWNGGKDCLVLLVLILACLPTWASARGRIEEGGNEAAPTTNGATHDHTAAEGDSASLPQEQENGSALRAFPQKLQAVYVVAPHPFPEVEDFVATTAQQYHLDISRYALPMKAALKEYLAERQAVRAVFVGTRRTDPHGALLKHFDPTDADWPQFMRVHPVIDWHYREVWAFIRHLNIPFCDLYNRGFTSLGGMKDTHRNPALALDDSRTKFRPAYELMDDDEERLGRNS